MPLGTRDDPFTAILDCRCGDLVGAYFRCQACRITICCDPRDLATDFYPTGAGIMCWQCFKDRHALLPRIKRALGELGKRFARLANGALP